MKWDQFAVGALNQWNVYDNVPLGGSISYTELATKCKVPEPRLRRVLKHAMTMHIFWAPTTDTVAHTNTSAELAREELLYAWVGHQIEECGSSATKLTEAIDRWGDSNG
jgi:6-hydroxytryprostatin B O-methyltransferase